MRTTMLFAATLVIVPGMALAEEVEEEEETGIAGIPVSATFGGGVVGFVDTETRDFATEGGAWEGRLAFNAGRRVELEAAYIGSLQNIDALGLDSTAQLLGTGFEAAIRINVLEGAWQPYAVVGGGWTRYDITNADTNTSDVSDSDNIAVIPLGVGLGYRMDRYLVDLRGTYRATTDADLIATRTNEATLDTWSASLRAGFQF